MVGGIALQGGMHSNEGVVRGCGIARLHRVASAAAAKRKQPAAKGFGAAAGNTQGNDDKDKQRDEVRRVIMRASGSHVKDTTWVTCHKSVA